MTSKLNVEEYLKNELDGKIEKFIEANSIKFKDNCEVCATYSKYVWKCGCCGKLVCNECMHHVAGTLINDVATDFLGKISNVNVSVYDKSVDALYKRIKNQLKIWRDRAPREDGDIFNYQFLFLCDECFNKRNTKTECEICKTKITPFAQRYICSRCDIQICIKCSSEYKEDSDEDELDGRGGFIKNGTHYYCDMQRKKSAPVFNDEDSKSSICCKACLKIVAEEADVLDKQIKNIAVSKGDYVNNYDTINIIKEINIDCEHSSESAAKYELQRLAHSIGANAILNYWFEIKKISYVHDNGYIENQNKFGAKGNAAVVQERKRKK